LAAPTTPYPTPLVESTTSTIITANLTKVINPTLTNELVFSYTYLNLPNIQGSGQGERSSLWSQLQLALQTTQIRKQPDLPQMTDGVRWHL